MFRMEKEIILTEVGSTSFIVVVPNLTKLDEETKLTLLREFCPYMESSVAAMMHFCFFVDKIRFLIGCETPTKFSVLGNATLEGIDLYINKKNRILNYNSITHAVIFHELAHLVDLKTRGTLEHLRRKPMEEILRDQNDPAKYSEWLYAEYAANKLLPSRILKGLKLVADANFLGSNGDMFFERMEKIYPGSVVAQVIQSFENLVNCYLPLYLNEPKEQQDEFSRHLLKASKICHKMWVNLCKNVLEGKPVYKRHFSKEVLLLITGHQIPPKQNFWFSVNFLPLPMKLKGKKIFPSNAGST